MKFVDALCSFNSAQKTFENNENPSEIIQICLDWTQLQLKPKSVKIPSKTNPNYLRYLALILLGHYKSCHSDISNALNFYTQAADCFDGLEALFLQANYLLLNSTKQENLDQVMALLIKCIENGKEMEKIIEFQKTEKDGIWQRKRELEFMKKAQEKLAMLYCQSGQDVKAAELLNYLGFSHRLSSHVLNYNLNQKVDSDGVSNDYVKV